jgi:hypothetical protein
MIQKHSNKELSIPYNIPTGPSQDGDHIMHLSNNDIPAEEFEDGDTVILHRPTVEHCLEKFKELKQKYNDLTRSYIILQAKLKASEEIDSAEKTSDSEETQSGSESDEDIPSGTKKPAATRLSKIVTELQRINTMTPSKQNQFIDTCHNDFIKCIGSYTRSVINGKAKLTPYVLKNLRRRKQLVRTLARKNTSLKTKRKILQTGGFLGLILPPVVSLMSSILKKQ